MNLITRRWLGGALLVAMLTAATLGVPARAGAEGDAEEGVATMIKYSGCALGIALSKTPQTLTMSVFLCLQMVYEEIRKG
jgi:hypothetical protein